MARRKHPDRGHDGDEKRKRKKHKPPKTPPKTTPPPKTATEQLKEASTQSGQQAMAATPTSMPGSNPDFEQAVYSTGPGEVVVYGYDRTGAGSEEYALQQSAYTAPVPAAQGPGQGLTPAAAGGQ